jgi:hypothetical protein
VVDDEYLDLFREVHRGIDQGFCRGGPIQPRVVTGGNNACSLVL